MGKQTNSLTSGKVGAVVFYVLNGKQYAKALGRSVRCKQTAATKASAKKFGQASFTARLIRSAFPALEPLSNREMRNGLTSAMHQWMLKPHGSTNGAYKSIHGISEYEFNKQVPLRKLLKKVHLEVEWDNSGKAIVSIPAIMRSTHIVVPDSIESVELWIGIVSCKPGVKSTIVGKQITSIIIPVKGSIPAQQVELPVSTGSGTMSMVAAGIRHIMYEKSVGVYQYDDQHKWMSARILEAVYRQ